MLTKHKWEKANLVTQQDKTGLHDIYRCANCNLQFKRYGLAWKPPLVLCDGHHSAPPVAAAEKKKGSRPRRAKIRR